MLRPTAEGPKVVQHGGDWSGQHSGFLMVPERGFALTVLTNSDTGPLLLAELFAGDWALARFAGVHNLPAVPRALPDAALAAYTGGYTTEEIVFDGSTIALVIDAVADNGQLSLRYGGQEIQRLAFYRKDYVVVHNVDGTDTFSRANFVRGPDGAVEWLRFGGRLFRRGPATAASAAARPAGRRLSLTPATLPYPLIAG